MTIKSQLQEKARKEATGEDGLLIISKYDNELLDSLTSKTIDTLCDEIKDKGLKKQHQKGIEGQEYIYVSDFLQLLQDIKQGKI